MKKLAALLALGVVLFMTVPAWAQSTTDDTSVSTPTIDDGGDQPTPKSDCDNPPPEATMCTDGE